ncbi:hypothetical protein YQE_01913, partial [Dendroctonus ponderosae]
MSSAIWMRFPAARRLNSSCSDLTIVGLNDEDRQSTSSTILATPVNRQRVLPFVPPSFPLAGSNKLIKPSEFLRSISSADKRNDGPREISMSEDDKKADMDKEEEQTNSDSKVVGPPPPPLPEFNAISIQDLNSVQLRRTEKLVASKTFSAPTRSVSLQCLNTADSFMAQKTDLIAELKMSKDLTGLKKMKIEKAKTEQTLEREVIVEIRKQFTANNFIEKASIYKSGLSRHDAPLSIPDKDNTGNLIPAWKRQMLAKKAAEKAKKEMEEQLQKDAEEKRLQSIPQWKRPLLAKKEETENKIRQMIYTPKVVEEPKVKLPDMRQQQPNNEKEQEDINNNHMKEYDKESNMTLSNNSLDDEPSDEEPNIIPWRAQLRKTNSSLNLL